MNQEPLNTQCVYNQAGGKILIAPGLVFGLT